MGGACSGEKRETPVTTMGTPVHSSEVEALAKRKKIADAAVMNLLKRTYPNETIAMPEGKTPVVGLAVSGGGWRSMTASVAFFDALSEVGALDAATYVCGVSGGGWAVYNWMLSTPDHNPFHGAGIPNPWFAGNRFDPSVHRYQGLIRMRDETWVRSATNVETPLSRLIWGIQDGILSSAFNIISDTEMVIPSVLTNEALGPNKVTRWGSFLRDDVLFWHPSRHEVNIPTTGSVTDGRTPLFANAMIADLPDVSEPAWAETSPFGFRRLAPHSLEAVPTDKLHVSFPDVKDPPVPARMHHMMAATGAAFALDPEGLLEQTVPDYIHAFNKAFGLEVPSTTVIVSGSQTRVTSDDGKVDFGLIRDAGILNNIPWPLFFNHMSGRHVDVLVVLDNSALRNPRPLNLARAIENGWYAEGVREGTPDQIREMSVGPEQHYCLTFHPKRKDLPIIVYCMGSNHESTFEVFVTKTDLHHSILQVRDRTRVGFIPAMAAAIREVAHEMASATAPKASVLAGPMPQRRAPRVAPENEVELRLQLNQDLKGATKGGATKITDSMKSFLDRSAESAAKFENATIEAIHDKLATFARQFHGDEILGTLTGLSCGGKLAAETGERFAHPFVSSWYAVAGKDGYVTDGLQSLTKDVTKFYSSPDLELVPLVAALHAIKEGKSSKERDQVAECLLGGAIDHAILRAADTTAALPVTLTSSAALSLEASAATVADLAKQTDVVLGSTARQGIRHQLKIDATMVALAQMVEHKAIDIKEVAAAVFKGERLAKFQATPAPVLLAIAESANSFELHGLADHVVACVPDEATREGYRRYLAEWASSANADVADVLSRGTPDAVRRLMRSSARPDAERLIAALEARMLSRDEAGFSALMTLSGAALTANQVTKLATDAFNAKLFWPTIANYMTSLPYVPTTPAGLDLVKRCTNVVSVTIDGAEATHASDELLNAVATLIRNSDVRKLELKNATVPLSKVTSVLATLPKHVSLKHVVVSGTTPVVAEQVVELLKVISAFHKTIPSNDDEACFTVEVPIAAMPEEAALPAGWKLAKSAASATLTFV